MDLIIFCGQSNMQGQCEVLSENAVVENAWEYKWLTDELVPLKNPVGENITYDRKAGYVLEENSSIMPWWRQHVTGSACYNHTNLVPSFCRTYTQMTKREVLAAHIAKGSTTIDRWLPGSDGYQILVQKTNAAREKAECEHVFLVWLQGESDAIEAKNKETYKNDMAKLYQALQKDVGLEKFGVIRVGRFTGDQRDEEIIAAQDEICLENPGFLMLTDIAVELNEQPEYMNPFVKGHYSAKGLEKLGCEAAKTMASYVK